MKMVEGRLTPRSVVKSGGSKKMGGGLNRIKSCLTCDSLVIFFAFGAKRWGH